MRIYKLNEARNKERFFKKHSKLTPKQKEELIKLYSEQYIPDDIIDWNKIESYSYDELYNIVDTFIKNREEKKNKKNLSKAIEGRDYIKLFENKNNSGTEYLYLPLTWNGSKYLASDHFLPKIKVPSKVMNANDFADNTAKNEDLSPGAKWCISLWTLPDYVIWNRPFKDENGKELRHEGKRYWLDYTSQGYYFLFYFRDFINLDDIHKKIALTLRQGSPKIEDITLADDTRGEGDSNIERVQKYWGVHFQEYKSQINHIRELSIKDYPEFYRYERQKEQEAYDYYNNHKKECKLIMYFTLNKETGRYDSKGNINEEVLGSLIKNSKIIVPLGVIYGNFDCSNLRLKTLRNGPTEVKGNFNCSHNDIKSLKYAPKKVGGDFNCSNNSLTTLVGSPKEVGGDFNCSNNSLTTLVGSPKEVGGNFDCGNNNLTTLKGAPLKTGKGFYCYTNELTSLEYSPREVGGDFACFFNNLTSLEYAPEIVGGNFYCFKNPLQSKELATEVSGKIHY